MVSTNMFNDPKIVRFQKYFSRNTIDYPSLASSLDSIFGGPERSRSIVDVGAGIGDLASLLKDKGYHVTVIEREEASVQELKREHPLLCAAGRVFHADIIDFTFNEHHDGVYMNQSVLLLMRNDNGYVIESYVGKPGSPDTSLEQRVLTNIRIGLKKDAPLVLSIQDFPDGTYTGEFEREPYTYVIRTFREGDYKVVRTRFLRIGKDMLQGDGRDKQEKHTLSYDDFEAVAKNVGFAKLEVSSDGNWLVMR